VAKVLVCGKTGSGNRLVVSLLRAAGVRTMLYHGERQANGIRWSGNPKDPESWTHLVIPIRDERYRQLSRTRVRPEWSEPDWDRYAFAWRYGIPILEVEYRAIVERPGRTRIGILEFVGAPSSTPWPTIIYDADAKYSNQG